MAQRGRPRREEGQVRINRPKKQHPLINAFSEAFWVIPWDGGYCLYDKTRYCKRANSQYLGKFYVSNRGDKYVFRDNYYDDVESLIGAMDAYNKTLPFSPEIYDPTYRKNYQIEMAVYDYLTSLGFKHINKRGVYNDIFILKDVFEQKICELELITHIDQTVGTIRRWVYEGQYDGRMIDVYFTSLETAIGAINSQISSYTSMLQVQLLNVFHDMTESRCSEMVDTTFDIKKANVEMKDATQQTIEYLEAELKRLKGE